MKLGLSLACFLLSASGISWSGAGEVLVDSGYVNGKAVISRIDPEDLAECPKWNLVDGEDMPLQPGKAVGLARKYLESKVKEGAEWSVERIRIERVGLSDFVYLIALNREIISGGIHPDIIVVVLMSGRVLPFENPNNNAQSE